MRVLSWIFQPVYLIFFAIIALLYFYRAEILPQHLDSVQSRALIERVEQAADALQEANPVMDQEVQASKAPQVVPPAEKVAGPEAQPAHELTAQAVPDVEPAEVLVDLVPQPGEGTPQEPGVIAAAVTQIETKPPSSLGALWYSARKSAMGGDIEQAITDYIQLTSSFPQHADGFGELGNLYYAQGDRERAMTAYQQALFIYQSLGAAGEALQLEKIIERLGSNSGAQ